MRGASSWDVRSPPTPDVYRDFHHLYCVHIFFLARGVLPFYTVLLALFGGCLRCHCFISIHSLHLQRLILHLACLMLRMKTHYTHAVYHVMNSDDAATLRTACACNCRCYTSQELDLSSDGRGERWQPGGSGNIPWQPVFSF